MKNNYKKDPEAVRPLIQAGSDAYRQGHFTVGAKIYLSALRQLKQMGCDDGRMAAVLYNLSRFYIWHKKYRKAESLLVQALAICERRLGRDHTVVGTVLDALADIYLQEGELRRAEALYKRSVHIDADRVVVEDMTVPRRMLKLSWTYCQQGKYDEAYSSLMEALKMQREALVEARTDSIEPVQVNFEPPRLEPALQSVPPIMPAPPVAADSVLLN